MKPALLSRRMRFGVVVICLGLIGLQVRPAVAASPEEVEAAIKKGIDYLYSKQSPDGNWEITKAPGPEDADYRTGGQYTGMTAIATYALLAADESYKSPRLVKPINFLLNNDSTGVYALGLRCQVWHLLGAERKDVNLSITKDANALRKGLLPSGNFDYSVRERNRGPLDWDHSVSQYGVLGMWACEQEGIEIPAEVWSKMDAAWRKSQHADGSWAYSRAREYPNDGEPEATMTAAGVASLFITQDELSKLRPPAGCVAVPPDPQIEKGLKWMADNFDRVFDGHQPYCLYGVSRIGVASGRKYFGTTDWFKRGADWLVQHQNADGSWGAGGEQFNVMGVPDTSFAILFLVRGRAPVIFEKLQYQGDWNERPRDIANLTGWIAKEIELDKFLNWEIVDFSVPADELHDASVMYISGKKAIDLGADGEQKLKQFIEDGGLVVFNADCGADGKPFLVSAEHLGMKLFPNAGEFRDLKPGHPLFSQFHQWKIAPVVRGLSNGARELMLTIPVADPARAWQGQAYRSQKDMFELGEDILCYGTDPTHLDVKGRTHIVRADPAITAEKTLKIARIQYDGNWDPEPGGWRRMAGVMHNQYQMDLQLTPVKITAGSLKEFNVAVLTGTDKVNLAADQCAELKSFVAVGGTLIVDAAGGSAEFGASVQAQLAAAFPDGAASLAEALPPEHPLYTQIGAKLAEFRYSPFARKTHPAVHIPLLAGIATGDRISVFYSAQDLSCGIVGQERDGIDGYSPATATAIVAHMLLYADSGGKPVAGP